MLVVEIRPDVAVPGPCVIAVLTAEPLACLRVVVVQERRVLAAIDRPEERVVQGLPAQRRGTVGRYQDAGCAIFFLGRVVHDRRVEHRHAFHAHHRVGEHRVVIDVQDDGTGVQVPARRRLRAGGETAVGDPVLLRSDLLDLLAEENDDGLLTDNRRRRHRARARRLRLGRLDGGEAGGVVEGAQLRFGVELGMFRGDPVVALREHDVAGRERAVVFRVQPHIVGVDLRVAALIHLDVADEMPVLLVVRALTAVADGRVGARLGRCLCGRRRRWRLRRLRVPGERPEHATQGCTPSEQIHYPDTLRRLSKGITTRRPAS